MVNGTDYWHLPELGLTFSVTSRLMPWLSTFIPRERAILGIRSIWATNASSASENRLERVIIGHIDLYSTLGRQGWQRR